MHLMRRRFIFAAVLAVSIGAAFVPAGVYSSDARSDDQSGDAVFVLGGTRGTGLEIVRLLEAQGRPVTVLVRESSNREALNETSASLVTGDALDKASIDAAMATGPFAAAISTLSGTEAGGWQVDSTGNINGIKAASDAGIPVFVLISSVGVGDSKDAVPPGVQKVLEIPFREKGKAEDYLVDSGLDYTIIRPGGLTNKKASGKGVLLEDPTVTGVISRVELARVTVESLGDEKMTNKIVTAVER
jgi:uncharacterized protein YbjT (DUF2867 family)